MTYQISDIIFVSMENWDDVWRRNQFVCAGLVKRNPDLKILFVGLPRDVTHSIRKGQMAALRTKAIYALPDCPNITVLQPLKVLPNALRLGRWVNESIVRRQIRRSATNLGLKDAILWLNPHTAVHMAGKLGEHTVIYDITDDWISAIQSDRLRSLTIAQDTALCRMADVVIVCSEKLHNMKRSLARSLALIPNGVDVEHYSKVMDSSVDKPDETRAWKGPVFGYTGTIHPERVDVGLVEILAKKFPNGTIALVGPDLLTPEDHARLRSLGNVVLTGPVPYRRLPDYMRAFDVCITPHCVSEFTNSLNPIKLWEYLASGKPIVSTNVAGFRDYSHLVYIADDAAAFATACSDALLEPADRGRARMEEARKHTWDARVDQIISVIEGVGKSG